MGNSVSRSVMILGCAVIGFIPSLGHAQNEAQADPIVASENGVGEIIVTARRQVETLQSVPLAITVLTEKELRRRSVRELEDVALLTPGLVFEDYANGGFGTPVIRGTTQFDITALEQNVSVFLDGIYIPRQYAFDLGTTNLERVEVVKGPQSALYGQNAFAGAINYVTSSRSMDRLAVEAEAGVGNFGQFNVGAKANVPINDMLAVRIAGGYDSWSGDFRNNYPTNIRFDPGTNGRIGGFNNFSVQAGLSLQIMEKLQTDIDYYHFDVSSETRPFFRLTRAAGDTNCSRGVFFGQPVLNLICGVIPAEPVPGPSGVQGLVIDPRSYGLEANTDVLRAAVQFKARDSLTFNYLFGHIESEVTSASNLDRDPLVASRFGPRSGNVFSFVPTGRFNYDSHEIRATYEGSGGLLVMLGGYLSDGSDVDEGGFGLVEFRGETSFPSQPPGVPVNRNSTNTVSRSIFGRVSYPFTAALRVSAEGRYTDEKKQVRDSASGRDFRYDDRYFTPRFTVDYQVRRGGLLYASAARGLKSGGVNTTSFAGLAEAERFFGPDTNWTYELGSKNSFLNNKVRFNLAAFYIDWSDLQTPSTPIGAPINTPTITTNLGSARSKGVEIEASARIGRFLTIDGTLAYIDATYNEGTISARIARANICDNIVCASNGAIGGNRLPRSSQWQYSIGLLAEHRISDIMEGYARLDLVGQSKQFVSEINVTEIEPRTLVNARAGLTFGRFGVDVYAKNLFDRQYVANAFFVANPFQVEYAATLGRKRSFGVTARFSY